MEHYSKKALCSLKNCDIVMFSLKRQINLRKPQQSSIHVDLDKEGLKFDVIKLI